MGNQQATERQENPENANEYTSEKLAQHSRFLARIMSQVSRARAVEAAKRDTAEDTDAENDEKRSPKCHEATVEKTETQDSGILPGSDHHNNNSLSPPGFDTVDEVQNADIKIQRDVEVRHKPGVRKSVQDIVAQFGQNEQNRTNGQRFTVFSSPKAPNQLGSSSGECDSPDSPNQRISYVDPRKAIVLRFKQSEYLQEVLDSWSKITELLDMSSNHLTQDILQTLQDAEFVDHQVRSFCNKMVTRMESKEYKDQPCAGQKVLVVGGGPCGLRLAIETRLLGAEVHVIEKRQYVSRNNILHLWEFVKVDLLNLGIKTVYPHFCTGEVHHISIRGLQMSLLKLSLMLGVHLHVPVSFQELLHPDSGPQGHGWRVKTEPTDLPVNLIDFDCIVDASGKRGILPGFSRRLFCPRQAIAITANFTNQQTDAEKEADQIPGIAALYSRDLFHNLARDTDVRLENLVYYKDRESHYFVMTVDRQTLVDKEIVKEDHPDIAKLLAPNNIDMGRLKYSAKEVAYFATDYAFESLEFSKNHRGEDDLAIFEFASRQEATHSCLSLEKEGASLLMCLVGDSLLEPFWPEGTGIARGFLGVLDAAWLLNQWFSGHHQAALLQRENLLTQLCHMTPKDLKKDLNKCTIDPKSRYAHMPANRVKKEQIATRMLSGPDIRLDSQTISPPSTPTTAQASHGKGGRRKRNHRRRSLVRREENLLFFKTCLEGYSDIKTVEDLDNSWEDGKALSCLIHKIRPDLVNLEDLQNKGTMEIRNEALRIMEEEFGVTIPKHFNINIDLDEERADKIVMHAFLQKVKTALKPHFGRLLRRNSWIADENPDGNKENENISIMLRKRGRRKSIQKNSLQHLPSVSEEEDGQEKRKSVLELRIMYDSKADSSTNQGTKGRLPSSSGRVPFSPTFKSHTEEKVGECPDESKENKNEGDDKTTNKMLKINTQDDISKEQFGNHCLNNESTQCVPTEPELHVKSEGMSMPVSVSEAVEQGLLTRDTPLSSIEDDVFQLNERPRTPDTKKTKDPDSQVQDDFTYKLIQMSDLQLQMEKLQEREKNLKKELEKYKRQSVIYEQGFSELEQLVLEKSQVADKMYQLIVMKKPEET